MDKKFIKLLSEFQKIPKIKRTFMEISEYPHYENVCSNILAFFFDTKNEHNLKDLFIKSLLQTIKPKNSFEYRIEKVNVEREVYTENNNRIDLVLETNDLVIGIENKIHAPLDNDLKDYSALIDNMSRITKKTPIKIVLSLKEIYDKQIGTNLFKNITYKDFFDNILKNLGDYIIEGDNDYIINLKEFIITILNQNGDTMVNKEMNQFCEKNFEAIKELILEFNKFKSSVLQKINHLKEFIDKGIPVRNSIKEWIYDKSCLVYDYKINKEYCISIDSYLHPVDGWEIKLFGRNTESIKYLLETMCISKEFLPKPYDKYEIRDKRLIYSKSKIDEFENVAKSLIDLLNRIKKYKDDIGDKD